MSEDPTNPKDQIGLTKAPLRLVPPALVIETAPAMANGASKYGPYNWRKKEVRLSVYLEAIYRHLLAYMDGEECAIDTCPLCVELPDDLMEHYDHEGGVTHLSHMSAGLAIIFDARAIGKLIDDRPIPGGAAKLLAAQAVPRGV